MCVCVRVRVRGDLYGEGAGGLADVGTGESERPTTAVHQPADEAVVRDSQSH